MKVQVLKSQRECEGQATVSHVEGVFITKRNASIEMKRLFGHIISTCDEGDFLAIRISEENSKITMSIWHANTARNAEIHSIEIVEKEVE